jgi:hypothetical protein
MKFVLAALVVAPVLYLVWASWRGRVQVRCCGIDARHDKRMAAAFADEVPDLVDDRALSPRLPRAGKACLPSPRSSAGARSGA